MTFWVTAAVSTLGASVACEFWARIVHRVLWHGPLWTLHKSHHAGPSDVAPDANRRGVWEANDLFALWHAFFAMGPVMAGLSMRHAIWGGVCVGFGAGLTIFGVAYALVHDAMIHKRVWTVVWKRGYWRRVRGAHLAHHRTGQAPYGLFLGPYERRERRSAVALPSADTSTTKAASGLAQKLKPPSA